MAVQAIAKMTLPSGSAILGYTGFFGDPVIATMLSVLVAILPLACNVAKR